MADSIPRNLTRPVHVGNVTIARRCSVHDLYPYG